MHAYFQGTRKMKPLIGVLVVWEGIVVWSSPASLGPPSGYHICNIADVEELAPVNLEV